MKIIAAYFNRGGIYSKLKTVFERSCKQFMPETELEILEMKMPVKIDHKRDTAWAFFEAANYALESKEALAICDIDIMFNGSIMDAFDHNFDIGITVRKSFKHPYNTGVWFYRPTGPAQEFLTRWIEYTEVLVDDFEKRIEFITQHGGIDQASLAMAMQEKSDAIIKEFPCLIYNAEQSCWANMTDKTKVIHIKSGLRKLCLNGITDDKIKDQWPNSDHRNAVYSMFQSYLEVE